MKIVSITRAGISTATKEQNCDLVKNYPARGFGIGGKGRDPVRDSILLLEQKGYDITFLNTRRL
ncbi:MAG: hypothetical protein QF598_00910 [Arenicellales bacterium]|jgi:hypothetical protein|nr:hypothetical protein [Arenicellales bacterium]MDP6854039.1 hypothetical protein [Arenicellales bacterium]|tara:strand:+ start:821 stop:1012 length:192 start_codon:yes stop_codon:yes gene_type:complete